MPSRAVHRLTLDCNNACLFCAQEGLPLRALEDDLGSALSALRQRSDELTFIGGEPTLLEHLPAAVRAARLAGFAKIGLQTNGRILASSGLCQELADAGLTDVHFSLHGAQPSVHDYHVGVPGAFRDLLVGLSAARAAHLVIVVNTVLTRSNHRVLGELPPLLRRLRVAGWAVTVPRVAGRSLAAFDRLVPRLALALPFALQALELAKREGLATWIRGAPACLLGPYASHALSERPRAFGPACRVCPARPSCAGVDPAYLARFGGDELRATSAAATSDPSHLARMFVELDELGPGLAAPPPETPVGTLVPLGRAG